MITKKMKGKKKSLFAPKKASASKPKFNFMKNLQNPSGQTNPMDEME
jgi:hypothetical protein